MPISLLADLKQLEKATPIRFIGGKYKKKKGWIDPTRQAEGNVTAVLIRDPKRGPGVYQTSVASGSIRKMTTDEAMSFSEAVFLVPDVECKVIELCRMLAQFGILETEAGIDEAKELFGVELENAKNWQDSKGDHAKWRRVLSWEARLRKLEEQATHKV